MMNIRRSSRWLAAVTLLLGAHASVASAQSTDATIGISYSFLRLLEGPDLNMPAGWLVSFAKPLDRSPVSVVGEVAGNYRSDFGETFRVHTFQAGLRLVGTTSPGVDPWAQLLVGGLNSGCCGASSTYFMIEPGAGVDLGLSRGVALRAGISLPIGFDDGDAFKSLRLQAGVVFPLASR